jgi:ABC-type glycerol-3-phosphate transport system substrate-binding protein
MKHSFSRFFGGILGGIFLLLGNQPYFLYAGSQSESKTAAVAPVNRKIDMVLMIELPTVPLVREKIIPMVRAKFPDINFVSKVRDDTQVEKAVKTAFIGGEAIDIVAYWPHQMSYFTEGNMVLDLTPYLEADPEWRSTWSEDILNVCKTDDKYYSIACRSSFPLIQVNKTLFDKLGIPIKEQWDWNEFLAVCKKIKESSDVFPVGINSSWIPWLSRNALLQIWDNEEEQDKFLTGNTSFLDPKVIKAYENVKTLFDNEYLYPGEGALTATNDQVLSAFARGRIAIIGNVNGNAGGTIKNTVNGAFGVETLSWPRMGKSEMDFLLGSLDGYFVSANTKYPDKTVEVLKYLTSPEIFQVWADDGKIVVSSKIKTSDPGYVKYGKDGYKVRKREVSKLSSALNDYLDHYMPANYLLYGRKSLEEVEAIRQDYLKNK